MEKKLLTSSTTVHIISHTHWDREWYLPYEKHHVRLIKLMDTLLETLEQDPGFRSFHLDGQTIILEDYLQIRPEKRPLLERMIREGRIHIGPWYILQDEFLTSSEANVRNLLYGHQDARLYGAISKVGYFPDSFGNMGQAPQLLQQAGITNAVFGRGVKPTGFNNQVSDSQEYESPFSEMIWEAPDGSRVLGILFANWYSNGNEIPKDREAARDYWSRKLEEVAKYASTPHWLMMNGCDHQPVQRDAAEAIKTASELYPQLNFVHSNFDDYIKALQASLPERLSVVKGELRSQHTDGWSTLVNTASSRIYLKQLNQQGQALLEKAAEPLAVFAHIAGAAYPHHLFTHAWKTLMQNHPHDSICGCSVDEVHAEMVARFARSRHRV
ncbi:alpha-mannosidase, partial [Paenibacillus sepulcri]|nr:alpha-mannosidase [Paenibacillus sepulcri]